MRRHDEIIVFLTDYAVVDKIIEPADLKNQFPILTSGSRRRANRSHGIYEGKNTTMHLYELMTRYLQENLL